MVRVYGCTVLKVVDHNRLEGAEAYRVMTLPVLCLSHCSDVRGCFLVCSHIPFLQCFSSDTEVAPQLLSGIWHLWFLLVTALVMLGYMKQAIKQGQLSQ